MQEAKRRHRRFPKGVSKEGRVGERVLGWGSEGDSANFMGHWMAGWARVSLLSPGLSFLKCKRTSVMSQMLLCWDVATVRGYGSKGRDGI